MQHPDPDRTFRIEQPHSQKLIFPVINNCQFAHDPRATLIPDAVGKKPRVTGAQNCFGLLRNPQLESGGARGHPRVRIILILN